MDGKIDWLSFTLPTNREPSTHYDLRLLSDALIKGVSLEHKSYLFGKQGYEPSFTRAPYRLSLEREDNGVKIFGNSHTETVLYELTGRACDGLREHAAQIAFISPLQDRISRMDYAVDIRTAIRPTDFANERDGKAFRTVSFFRSDTGETVYIGSTKSDRYCRIYRYNAPHPRSELLRIEFVFRRGLAQHACRHLCSTQTAGAFMAALGNTFAFRHMIWRPTEITNEKVTTPIMTQRQEDTVAWLYKQVAPAVRRLLRDGVLDITDWLEFVYMADADKATPVI